MDIAQQEPKSSWFQFEGTYRQYGSTTFQQRSLHRVTPIAIRHSGAMLCPPHVECGGGGGLKSYPTNMRNTIIGTCILCGCRPYAKSTPRNLKTVSPFESQEKPGASRESQLGKPKVLRLFFWVFRRSTSLRLAQRKVTKRKREELMQKCCAAQVLSSKI